MHFPEIIKKYFSELKNNFEVETGKKSHIMRCLIFFMNSVRLKYYKTPKNVNFFNLYHLPPKACRRRNEVFGFG